MLPESNYDLNNNQNNEEINQGNIAMNQNNVVSQENVAMNQNNMVNQENVAMSQNNIVSENIPNNVIQPNLPNSENIVVNNNFSKEANDIAEQMKIQEQINEENNQTKALFAYLGPFVLIPFFQEKENPFILFHAKQGMNLFILEIIMVIGLEIIKFILPTGLYWLASILDILVGIVVIGLSVIGIFYVLNNKMRKMPIIGDIKIIK